MIKYTQPIIDVNIGVSVFFLQDLVIKEVSGHYPITQLLIVRCLTALPILLWLITRISKNCGIKPLFSPRYKILIARGLLAVVAYSTYYLAFPVMPIANILSLFAITPIVLAFLGWLFMGEKINFAKIIAIFIGFIGSLIILRPGIGDFQYASLFPLIAACTYSASQIINRKYLQNDEPPVVATYQSIAFLIFSLLGLFVFQTMQFKPDDASLIFLTRDWVEFNKRDLFLIALTGPISSIGLIYLSKAYRAAPTAIVGPFEYVGVLLAFITGFVFWNETPDIYAFLGAFLIIISGFLIIKK